MLENLRALDRLVHDLARFLIHVVNLKYMLCNVDSNWRKLHLGLSGLPVKIDMIFHLENFDAVGP